MSITTLRRQVKNVAYNFSDAQVKVREATSNDPWGPTTALMSEIADMTHNAISFSEIMSMIWKRLNDHGKNWRHVYKSLVLLDYLIKCGSERVSHQCCENIYAIETLKDFQHIEDNRDQGLNIRTKSKQLVELLKDEERLKNERARFLMTRKRLIQNGSGSAISSSGAMKSSRRPPPVDTVPNDSEFEEARPVSIGEEEMQLQIALALSREECEKEQEMRRGDEIRLQMALEESKRGGSSSSHKVNDGQKMIPSTSLSQSVVDDLLSMGLGDVFNNPQTQDQLPSTSQSLANNDPWSPQPSSSNGIKSNVYPSLQSLPQSSGMANDPWSPHAQTQEQPPSELTFFDGNAQPEMNSAPNTKNDPWSILDSPAKNGQYQPNLVLAKPVQQSDEQPMQPQDETIGSQRPNLKTPECFLGQNSLLVNLDNLMGPSTKPVKTATNPFIVGSSSNSTSNNPFVAQQRPSPSLNEMKQAQIPPNNQPANNPFS